MKRIVITLNLITPIFASGLKVSPIHWGVLIMGLFGGLALFLYGMEKMSAGMKKAAGNRMRNILSMLTHNRLIAMFVGAFVTMVIQSSSATTVMLVSFVQAQLMTYVQSIGIILGANIGTTITAQLIAFKLTDYALLMITVGFALTMFSKKDSYKYLGEAILGFGILFFGMKLMSDAMRPLREFQPFIDSIKGLENPFIGLLIGAGFTALIQSSSALTGIVIVLAQQGLLTLEAGIPLIFGANVGTCITAWLASIGTAREAKRVALAHILFNLSGVILFFFFIPYLADVVRIISPTSHGSGLEKLAAETPRQIANAHTIFNVIVGLVFLPFTHILAKYVIRILPEIEIEKGIQPVIWHLDKSQIHHPSIAIGLAQSEILTMVKLIRKMLKASIKQFFSKNVLPDHKYPELTLSEGIHMRENKIDFLEEKVTQYLFEIGRSELNDKQTSEIYAMTSIVKDLESIGDVIDKNIVPLMKKKEQTKFDFTSEGKKELVAFHTKVMKQVSRLTDAFSELNLDMANKIVMKDLKYRDLESDFRKLHMERVQKELTKSIATHEVHLELMDLFKQINVYLANIAKTISRIDPDHT